MYFPTGFFFPLVYNNPRHNKSTHREVFGQSSVQVSIYPFRMTDANMQRHKFSYYKDFWAQLKPGYDYFEQTRKPPTVSVVDGRYVVSKPLSHEVVQPQLASNYTLPETK